jgi:cytochrome c oxidase assembly protein subunit 11
MKTNSRHAVAILMLAAGMFALAFAAIPLYELFCKTTGYGGTTATAESWPTTEGKRLFKISFNADISPNLDWQFKPEQTTISLKSGARGLAFYHAENLSNKPVTGHAIYNVTPNKAGKYFHKVHCFCFENQTLAAKEQVSMPVSFFIDPAIESDPLLDDVDEITLSYTFFETKKTNPIKEKK